MPLSSNLTDGLKATPVFTEAKRRERKRKKIGERENRRERGNRYWLLNVKIIKKNSETKWNIEH